MVLYRSLQLRLCCIIFLFSICAASAFSSSTYEEIISEQDFNNVKELIIEDAHIFNIEIEGVNRDTVSVQFIKPDKAPFSLHAEHHAGKLWLDIDSEKKINNVPSGTYLIKIQVPVDCSVSVKTATGAVAVQNIISGVEISSSTGDIQIKNIEGRVDINSDTGSIFADTITGTLEAELQTGNFNLLNFFGNLSISSETGLINGVDVYIEEQCELETSIGMIHIDVLNDLETFSFDISSTLGQITIGTESFSHKIKTKSGDINLSAESELGSISIY